MAKQKQMTEKELDQVAGGATMVEYALIVANTVDYGVKGAPTAKPPLRIINTAEGGITDKERGY